MAPPISRAFFLRRKYYVSGGAASPRVITKFVTFFLGDTSDDDEQNISKTGLPNVIVVQEYKPGITDGVPNKHLVEKDRLRGVKAMQRKEARTTLPSNGIRRF